MLYQCSNIDRTVQNYKTLEFFNGKFPLSNAESRCKYNIIASVATHFPVLLRYSTKNFLWFFLSIFFKLKLVNCVIILDINFLSILLFNLFFIVFKVSFWIFSMRYVYGILKYEYQNIKIREQTVKNARCTHSWNIIILQQFNNFGVSKEWLLNISCWQLSLVYC